MLNKILPVQIKKVQKTLNDSDAGMQCQCLWKSVRDFILFLTVYRKRRWTFRNCLSSHTALMPESSLSRLHILPTVTTHSRNSSENLIKGDTCSACSQRLLHGQQAWEWIRIGWHTAQSGDFWWPFCIILKRKPGTQASVGILYGEVGYMCYWGKY